MGMESTSGGDASSRTPGPDEVYCRDCGSIIKERAEICPECGVRQRSAIMSNFGESGIAAVASLLIPGAGQIFLGHIERGLLFIAATFVAAFMSMFLVGIPVLLAVWVYAIYDAYKLGEDPTRAGRVWGGEPGATPIVDTGRSTGSEPAETVGHEHEATTDRAGADESVVGETDQRPKVDTDVTGDRTIAEDEVTGDERETDEGADFEERAD